MLHEIFRYMFGYDQQAHPVDRARIARLVELLGECGILGKIKFLVDGRSNLVDEDLVVMLERLGVVLLSLGIESGSPRMLEYLKRGSVTVEQNREAIRLANQAGTAAASRSSAASSRKTVTSGSGWRSRANRRSGSSTTRLLRTSLTVG